MKKSRQDTYTTGMAAEHLIMSCLTRLQLEVYLTMGNRKKTDIRVINPETKEALSVDVKAVSGYSSLIVNNVKASDDHYIVFVIFNKKLNEPTYMPDIYVVPSNDVSVITEDYNGEKRVMKGKLQGFKDRWDYLTKKKVKSNS